MNKEEYIPSHQTIREAKIPGDDEQQKYQEKSVESRTSNVDNVSTSDDKAIVENQQFNLDQTIATVSISENKSHVSQHYECASEAYDVITGAEVQDIKGWESILKESLSEIPPIDHGALNDLESRAKHVAGNLDHLLGTLAASLKSMSVVSVQSVEAYKTSIENVEDAVDISVKNMYSLIAKCEELNANMAPLYTMATQIKDIKRTLDVLESVCK